LNERLRRGGSQRPFGREVPGYSVVGSRESVPEETTRMPLRPGMMDA
jgi:hypothetical protein